MIGRLATRLLRAQFGWAKPLGDTRYAPRTAAAGRFAAWRIPPARTSSATVGVGLDAIPILARDLGRVCGQITRLVEQGTENRLQNGALDGP